MTIIYASKRFERKQRKIKIHSFTLQYYFKSVRVNGDILYKMNQAKDRMNEVKENVCVGLYR